MICLLITNNILYCKWDKNPKLLYASTFVALIIQQGAKGTQEKNVEFQSR